VVARVAKLDLVVDAVSHGHRDIGLVVKAPGNDSNRAARHQFAHKSDAASHAAVGQPSPHIETEIHFRKVHMPRNRHAEQARAQKAEAHETHERAALKEIELRSHWHARCEPRGIDLEVRDHELTPLAGKERDALTRTGHGRSL